MNKHRASQQALPIFWNGRIVGYIINPQVDNFHMYGVWQPNHTIDCTSFLMALDSGQQLTVDIGTEQPLIQARVDIKPENYVEVILRT
jgi:hypothetical protein